MGKVLDPRVVEYCYVERITIDPLYRVQDPAVHLDVIKPTIRIDFVLKDENKTTLKKHTELYQPDTFPGDTVITVEQGVAWVLKHSDPVIDLIYQVKEKM